MKKLIVHSPSGVTLIGNGDVTPELLANSLTIAPVLVAADGGADAALRHGHIPVAVIGDMDSVSAAARAAIPRDRIHWLKEQDTTDFDKCLRNIAAPFILAVGFTGARIDHALAVFNTLVRHPDRRCIILGGTDLCFLAPPTLDLHLPVGTRVSLFPMGPVHGTSLGLRWPIDGIAFAPDGRSGTSNETVAPAVGLRFDTARMLVILPVEHLAAAIAALSGGLPSQPVDGS